MIFNFLPFLVGYIFKINNHKFNKISILKILLFFFIFLLLFVFSVIATSKIRSEKNILNSNITNTKLYASMTKSNLFNENKIKFTDISFSVEKLENFKKIKYSKDDYLEKLNGIFRKIVNIIMFRFVGIEGVMAVQGKNNKSFDLYLESLREKYRENNVSFYDANFLNETSTYTKSIKKFGNQHAITLPGFIAHSYYAGSYYFVFFSAIFASIFCNLILSTFQSSFNNCIFNAFVANLLCYRLIHWGFAPLNSYKLILGIFISVIFIVFTNYAIKKLYFKK